MPDARWCRGKGSGIDAAGSEAQPANACAGTARSLAFHPFADAGPAHPFFRRERDGTRRQR